MGKKALGIALTTVGALCTVGGGVLLGLGTNWTSVENLVIVYKGAANKWQPKTFVQETKTTVYEVSENEIMAAVFNWGGEKSELSADDQARLKAVEDSFSVDPSYPEPPFQTYIHYGVGSLNFGEISFHWSKEQTCDYNDPAEKQLSADINKVLGFVYDNINSRPQPVNRYASYKSAVSACRNSSNKLNGSLAFELDETIENVILADDMMISGAVLLPIFTIVLAAGIILLVKSRR